MLQVSAREHFDVWHEVPLVHQTTGMSCWAAAAAMIVGWRDCLDIDPEELARGADRWQEYREGLEPHDVESLAAAFGLVIEPVREYTVEALRDQLERYGPLWMGEASPGLHVIVIAGMFGDATHEGTFVRVADPWPIGAGERYTIPFVELRRNFDAVQQLTGVRACVLHAGGAPRGNRRLSWERSVTARLSGKPTRGASMHKYLVDCGHGGRAAAGKSTPYGSRGVSGTTEKDITLELGRRIARALGPDALLTRDGDYNLPLAERIAIAQRHRPLAFVSIHAGEGGGRGAETWTHSSAHPRSAQLAQSIHGELARLGAGDRGLHRGELAVLAPERLPRDTAACLVEIDSLGHPDGERRLRDSGALDRIAQAIASGLRRYGDPQLVPRCYQHDTTVPPSYDALESDVRNWVATCVTSRTEGMHRERELVDGNPSLAKVWDSVRSAPVGTPFTISADYTFDQDRATGINFSSSLIDMSEQEEVIEVMTPDQSIDRILAAIRARKAAGETYYDGVSLDRMECLCQKAKDPNVDHRVLRADLIDLQYRFQTGEIGLDAMLLDFRTQIWIKQASLADEHFLNVLVQAYDRSQRIVDKLIQLKDQQGGAYAPRLLQLSRWIADKMNDPNHIYSCFRPLQ